jgi:3-phosphoshikimate 1-carboxyvinyltransferase
MQYQNLIPKQFTSFKGSITPEKSKSIANRVLLLQALSANGFFIDNPGNSDDVRLMQAALKNKSGLIDAGMAGTVLRFLTAGFSIMPGNRILTGSERLKQRPMNHLTNALTKLGAALKFTEKIGFAPIEIIGKPLEGGKIKIDSSVSSQFISALMLIGPFLKEGLEIELTGNTVSNSYIELTCGIMRQLGFGVEIRSNQVLIEPGKPKTQNFKIEADWSAAAYWLAFVALIPNAEITLKGLSQDSLQGDSEVLAIIQQFGVETSWDNDELIAKNNPSFVKPNFFEYDFTQMPDQAQTFAFLCAAMGVEAKFKGLQTLKHKETDRILALQKELEKLGLVVDSSDHSIKLSGKITATDVSLSTYNDHRMAMAGALIATQIPVRIENPDVVSKSYPDFWSDLSVLTNN